MFRGVFIILWPKQLPYFLEYKPASNTSRVSNTGRGSDEIVLIEAGGFYSWKYGIHTLI